MSRDEAWFLSDVHLRHGDPDYLAQFTEFLAFAATRTKALWLVGDIFEFWSGDRQARSSFFAPLFTEFRRLRDDGLDLRFVRGNRDVLMDSALADAGATDAEVVHLDIASASRAIAMRRAEARGLPPVTRPDPFPQHSLLAARVATHGLTRGWGEDFTRAMFSAQFAQGRDLSTQGVTGVLEGLGLDASAALLAAKAPEVKESLRAASDAAMAHGLFGAPCFTTPDGELFWGDDRLEDALGWAARLG